MSTPLSAGGRITLPYTIANLQHKLRVFVRNPTAVGGSFNINSRSVDANDIVWTDALNDLATAVSYLMGTGFSFGDGVLEKQTGGIYTALATATPSYTDHSSGTAYYAWQATFVLRDVLLKKVKIVHLEGDLGAHAHSASRAAIPQAGYISFIKEFMSDHVLTNAPYVWVVGKGNQYLNTSPFVGFTNAGNRRVRRRRGLT